jgi:hypothetical protein
MILAPTLSLSAGSGAAIVRPTFSRDFAGEKTLNNGTGPAITFTRGTNATFFDASGTLRFAPFNLLQRSEEFDNAAWAKNNATVTANSTTAPDGTTSADTLTSSNATAAMAINNTPQVAYSAGTYTLSLFVKTNGWQWVQLRSSSALSSGYANFDIVNGALGTASGATASLASVGGGWFRIAATFTVSAATGDWALNLVTATDSARNSSTTGNGTSGVYIWGAQLVTGSQAGEYFQTTDAAASMPRFDHDPATGASRGLLIEEARTNLLERSAEFGNAYWTKNNCSITPDATSAPTNTQVADTLFDTSGSAARSLQRSLITVTTGIAYTWSIFGKNAGRRYLHVRGNDTTTNDNAADAVFDLQNGVISGAATARGTWSAASASMVSVGNGWYRCSLTATVATTSVFAKFQISSNGSRAADGNADSYTGDPANGIHIWGAQLEAGAFPTSYIPTTSAAATRSADVAAINPIASFYNESEGTLFCEFVSVGRESASIVNIDSGVGGNTNRHRLYLATSSATGWQTIVSTNQTNFVLGNANAGDIVQFAGVYKQNDFQAAVGGTLGTADTAGNVPTASTHFRIGRTTESSSYYGGHIRKVAYWPKRLSNTLLQQLTT